MAITIKGLKSLRTKLKNMGGDSAAAILRAINQTTLLAEASAKANAPSSSSSQANSTGSVSLRAGIEHEVKSTTERIEGRVFSNAPHSVFVEMGTGPVGASNHMGISPNVNPTYTTRKSWAFPIVIDGEETFRTTSGQPARPFMYPAAVEHKDTHSENIRRELVLAMRRLAKGGG